MNRITLTSLLTLISLSLFAQNPLAPKNWHLDDYSENQLVATDVTRAYQELLQSKNPSEIVVAILDSGVDIEHEDLKQSIWINQDEVPGNNIDDDNNGYVDDVHGWSFLGSEKGDVHYDNLEFTRIYKQLKAKYEGKTESEIEKSDKKEFEKYQRFEKEYSTRVENATNEYNEFMQIYGAFQQASELMKELTRKQEPTIADIEKIEPSNEMEEAFKNFILEVKKTGMEGQLDEGYEHYFSTLEYMYNLDFDSRPLVGDNYSDVKEKYYGNNHIEGPDARHGTHVAGIVSANRQNDLGAVGINKSNVKIMSVRVVPSGDERDKDVANAIRYAADNGAHIINMSFGKSYSPDKEVVDEAVKYAADKGVLLIHAAGNSSKNVDKSDNFPNDDFLIKGKVESWMEVGSLTWEPNEEMISDFSNYGKKSIDIFAPGSDIYSTVPNDKYELLSGTSMAAPVVAGVAALVWSYYPELSAKEVKEILIKSSVKLKKKEVIIPGKSESKTKFKSLGKNGGVINAYNALKLAAEY